MVQQASSRTAIVWDAILLGGAILITVVAGAYQLSQRAEISAVPFGYKVADGVGSYKLARAVDASPADGSIIIECMALGDRVAPYLGASRDGLSPLLVTIPAYQLGPSKCWPEEHKQS
jgi:hypothetical protein